uniref:Uncharacterized protein n=1 Tax=Cacopsylla melanoneura TaxID=428564 RepID=A0A8D8VAP7_9HEMI
MSALRSPSFFMFPTFFAVTSFSSLLSTHTPFSLLFSTNTPLSLLLSTNTPLSPLLSTHTPLPPTISSLLTSPLLLTFTPLSPLFFFSSSTSSRTLSLLFLFFLLGWLRTLAGRFVSFGVRFTTDRTFRPVHTRLVVLFRAGLVMV